MLHARNKETGQQLSEEQVGRGLGGGWAGEGLGFWFWGGE